MNDWSLFLVDEKGRNKTTKLDFVMNPEMKT